MQAGNFYRPSSTQFDVFMVVFFQYFVLSLKYLVCLDCTLRSSPWLLTIRPTAPLYVFLLMCQVTKK